MTLQQLIIRNLSILEQATPIGGEIDKSIINAVHQRVKDCVERWPDWRVVDDDDQPMRIWTFGPKNWPRDPEKDKEKEKDMASFYLWYTGKFDATDSPWELSTLTGAVAAEYGIFFTVNTAWMTHLAGRGARPTPAWERFLASQLADHQTLHSKGFRLIGPDLFLPIRIAADDLADSYPDTLEDALTPVDDAMAILHQVHPEIDAIIKAAAEQFPSRVPATREEAPTVTPLPSLRRKSAGR